MGTDATVRPLLRWAGSKRSLLDELVGRCPAEFRTYIEPFAGSACLFFRLAPSQSVLGDINTDVIDLYRYVRWRPKVFADQLQNLERRRPDYYQLRDAFNGMSPSLSRSVHFLHLNRNCFNGLYRTNRRGEFNVPKGTRCGRAITERQIRCAGELLKSTQLKAASFSDTLKTTGQGDFIYADPPYLTTARPTHGEYGYDSLNSRQLDELIETLLEAAANGAKVLLSYADTPQVREKLRGWKVERVASRRRISSVASSRGWAGEILARNYG